MVQEFEERSPHISEFEAEMEYYERWEGRVEELQSQHTLTAAIQLSCGEN